MFINEEIRKRSSKFYHIGLDKKADMWTWLSGRPLTICQWKDNRPTRKRDVAVILKGSKSDEQCMINYFRRYKRAAYICEISNGKTKPLLFHIGRDNSNVIIQTFRNPRDHYRRYEASNKFSRLVARVEYGLDKVKGLIVTIYMPDHRVVKK